MYEFLRLNVTRAQPNPGNIVEYPGCNATPSENKWAWKLFSKSMSSLDGRRRMTDSKLMFRKFPVYN